MSHPEEGLFHALLDGELTPDEVRTIEVHVATCAACAARLAEARAIYDESNQLVERLEMPERKASRATTPDPVPVTPAKRVGIPPQRLRTLVWAATVLIAAGVGYAVGDWRHRLPGEAETVSVNDRIAPASTAATGEAFGDARSSELERGEPRAFEGAVETETSSTVGGEIRTGGEVEPAEQPAGRANEAPAAPAAAPPTQVDAVAPKGEEADAGVPSRGAVVGGAQFQARDARRDQLAQEAAEGERQRGQDAFAAANRPAPTPTPPTGALGVGDSAMRQPGVSRVVEGARREVELENAKAAPAAELRARADQPRTATLEEAVETLNGAIRLIEGASLSRVEIADPPTVPWATVESPLVRAIYQLEGAEVVLSQVRLTPRLQEADRFRAAQKPAPDAAAHAAAVPLLAAGDTLFASAYGGGYRVWWLDGTNRLISLSGALSQDALWRIVRRIR